MNYGNNSGVVQGEQADASSSHFIDMTCLAILVKIW